LKKPRRKLSNPELEYARNLCAYRDNGICPLCSQLISSSDHVSDIHHIDGNSYNNPKDGSNWQLTHHSCNVVEYYVRKRLEAIDGIDSAHIQYQIGTRMELAWMRFMVDAITKENFITWERAKFTGALEADCSPETTKRYLQKHIADSEHPKSLFKIKRDQQYNNRIIFTDHTKQFIEQNSELV